METTHTPGPWELETGHPLRDEISDANGDLIADVTVRQGPGKHKDHANARLIAAAPELLDACIVPISQLTEDRPEYYDLDVAQLRDAIARATGE